MGRATGNVVWAAISAVVFVVLTPVIRAIFKAIFTVEIEEYWNGTVQPFLTEIGWARVAAMLEYVPTFWGGVVATLLLLFAVDRIRARFGRASRRSKPALAEPVAVPATGEQRTPLADVAATLISRLRGKRAFKTIEFNSKGPTDQLRRTADFITGLHPVTGRIPGTRVLQDVPAGSYFMQVTTDGELVAVSDPHGNDVAFEDLGLPTAAVEAVIASVIESLDRALA